MASVCISNCVKDTHDQLRVPVRATYRNLYKWPESDAEFVRSVTANMRRGVEGGACHPRVVDSISCRQMYLRSYTFSRKEEEEEEEKKLTAAATKCLGQRKKRKKKKKKQKQKQKKEEEVVVGHELGNSRRRKKSCLVVRNAIFRLFRTLLACSASVDVVLVDPKPA